MFFFLVISVCVLFCYIRPRLREYQTSPALGPGVDQVSTTTLHVRIVQSKPAHSGAQFLPLIMFWYQNSPPIWEPSAMLAVHGTISSRQLGTTPWVLEPKWSSSLHFLGR